MGPKGYWDVCGVGVGGTAMHGLYSNCASGNGMVIKWFTLG